MSSSASPAPVAFETARGPVSPSKNTAILDALKSQSDTRDILLKHLALEESINRGSPLVLGNRLVLLQDGPATYKAMFAAIRAARDHINLETYIFEPDEVGTQFAALLLEKQTAGVQVNLIYDSVGCIDTPREFFERLRAGGIRTLESTRSIPLQTEGPAVAEFQRYFLDTWARQKAPPLPSRNYFPALRKQGNEIVRAIGSEADATDRPIYLTLLSAIGHAERNIHLTIAYFVPDPQLRAALADAVRRGVEVQLILPGKTDSWAVFHAGRSHYDELLSAGVRIYERRDAVLHSKTASIDGVWSTIGSTNLDWRSFCTTTN